METIRFLINMFEANLASKVNQMVVNAWTIAPTWFHHLGIRQLFEHIFLFSLFKYSI